MKTSTPAGEKIPGINPIPANAPTIRARESSNFKGMYWLIDTYSDGSPRHRLIGSLAGAKVVASTEGKRVEVDK